MKHRYGISVRGSMSPAVAERVSRVHAMAVLCKQIAVLRRIST